MGFDDIVTGHIEWIDRLAFAYCNNKEDAEDLAQDTLCRILCNREKFDCRYDFKPWAKTVMENIYKTRYRRNLKVPFVGINDNLPFCSPYSADQLVSVESILDVVDRTSQNVIGVECVMLFANGMNYDEIADITGIGVGTVKSRIYQGRKALRRTLGYNVSKC